MSLCLTVRYAAPGLADLDDEIVFIAEEVSFKVPILARRVPPELSMENPIVAAPCWLGIRSDRAVRCTNNGGSQRKTVGETGFTLLPAKSDEEPQSEFLRLGPFTVFPSQFYLQKGESISMMVLYAPETPGEHTEEFVVETAFQTRMSYQLKGTGCTLSLEATALDAMALNFKENPLSVIHFDVTMPKTETTRKLKIRNNCGMKVQYHWSIYKNKITDKISLSGEETHFTIEPLQGTFNAYEEQECEITFKPLHAESYFEFADLIVDDIPIQAVLDAPESLKALLSSELGGPSYLGSNTRYPSFPYMSFSLEGYGDLYEVVPEPPAVVFPGDLLIAKEYSAKLKLLNKSKSKINVRMQLRGKSSEDLGVELVSERFAYREGVYLGTLNEEEEEIEVVMKSKKVGEHRAYFVGNIEDGSPFSFEILGHFVGPRVQIYEKNVEFGLVKAKGKYDFTLNLENTTDIEAEVLIKTFKDKKLTFDTVNPGYAELLHDLEEMEAVPEKDKDKTKISITPEYKKLLPHERATVLITLQTSKQETVEDYVEVDTKHGETQYLAVHAEVQKPCVHLNQSLVELGVTYAGLQYKVDERHKHALVLANSGNLDAHFEVC